MLLKQNRRKSTKMSRTGAVWEGQIESKNKKSGKCYTQRDMRLAIGNFIDRREIDRENKKNTYEEKTADSYVTVYILMYHILTKGKNRDLVSGRFIHLQ